MSRITGSRNRPDHQKVEDAFADLSIVDQANCLAACGALHRWKVGMETPAPKLVPPIVPPIAPPIFTVADYLDPKNAPEPAQAELPALESA